jgi:hypothetical protein
VCGSVFPLGGGSGRITRNQAEERHGGGERNVSPHDFMESLEDRGLTSRWIR